MLDQVAQGHDPYHCFVLDDNEVAQKRAQGEQDGSEVRSVELERLIALGLSLTERRNAFEFTRDAAAEVYGTILGSLWRPRSGSQVNRRTMTGTTRCWPTSR